MNLPILYSFRRCPYAMRARMAIILSSKKCELREIVLKNKPEEMLQISPKGTVPILELTNEVLDESLDIISWAMQSHPESVHIFSAKEKLMSESLIQLFDTKFKYHLDRYKYATRYANVDPLFHRDECKKILLKVNDLISDEEYFFGKELNKIDISILPFLRQFRIADIKWFDEDMNIPRMQKYVHKFLESKLLEDVMVNFDEWKPGSDIRIFP